MADRMIVHVLLNFHGKKLGRDHHADLAIPLSDAKLLRVGIESATVVLVEASHHADIVFARFDGVTGGDQ